MAANRNDTAFQGSVPEIYERHMVPLIFEPYAIDLAARVASRRPRRVLEIAAGTGVVTRELARRLDAGCEIVATDLQPPMLAQARARGTARPVEWQQADAMQLPFDDATFDAVVCQFGAMFFPDKPAAYAQCRRVLEPGGLLAFNVWDRTEDNEIAAIVNDVLATLFPDDPPRFMARVPHGYHDRARIEADLRAGGWTGECRIETLTLRARAASARDAAIGYCQGTPLRGEIDSRDPQLLERATDVAADAIARRFGEGPIDTKMQALVIEVSAA